MIRLGVLLGVLIAVSGGSLVASPGPGALANLGLMAALWGFVLALLWILWVRADYRRSVLGPDRFAAPPSAPDALPKVAVICYRENGQASVLWGDLLSPAEGSL